MLSQTSPNAIVLSTYNSHDNPFNWKGTIPADNSLPRPLKSILADINSPETMTIHDLSSAISIDSVQIANVEAATMGQSTNQLWYSQRAGRITASKANSIMHTNIRDPSKSLLDSICHPAASLNYIPALKWGLEKESFALEALHNFFEGNDTNVRIMTHNVSRSHDVPIINSAGFRICQQYPWIGASPDGYVNCECCGFATIEVKCPYKYAQTGMSDDFFNDKYTHLEENGSLKINHPYYSQVQLQMYICQADFSYFITWTTINCWISRVQFDENFTTNMLETLNKFWFNSVIPMLTATSDFSILSGECSSEAYCKCQKNKDEPMVGCDNNDCSLKWFHYSCVGLKTKPRSKMWFCSKQCKQQASAMSTTA